MATKVGILSLGCARNLVDSEILLGRLKDKDYEILDLGSVGNNIYPEKEKIDVALVNTCAFIKEAKEESIRSILDLVELKKQGRLKRIIVAGCLSQRYKEELFRELPEVDAFLGVISLNHTQKRRRLVPGHYAYVKICEGCINNCSYCVIPKIKTGFKSRSIDSVISEIQALDNQGCKEINLIGQDITAYGWDLYSGYKLDALIKKTLKKLKSIEWLRLLYLSPRRLNDELIAIIAKQPKIVKYIDLPLQHINERILKLMNRKISSSQIKRLIDKIRKQIPSVAIRTSFIVGFPTETDKEFKQLCNFIKEVKFERLGLFMYSREKQTPAYNFPNQVPQRIKEQRYNAIMSSQQDIASQVNKKWLGQILKVLIEEKEENGLYIGRSQYDAPEVDGVVFVKSHKKLAEGSFVDVKITDTLEYDLVAEAIV